MKNVVETISLVKSWQATGQKVVLVTGVFDLLHIEHIRFLQKAKAAGDKLIVGLETDIRVQTIKGNNRPLHSQDIRHEQVASLRCVDVVFFLPEEFSTQTDWTNLIKDLHPDIYAASSHSSHLENKKLICDTVGTKFQIVHTFNPDYSSSKLLEQMRVILLADHE